MRILALDSALAGASAAVLEDGTVLAAAAADGGGRLAGLAESALRAAGLASGDLDAVAACVGPGSFTGIRTGLALAAGIGLAAGRHVTAPPAAGIPVIGVSVGEALAAVLPALSARALWVAIDSRRGRIFLERQGHVVALTLAGLPDPTGPVLLAGDAAEAAAEALAARGADVRLADVRVSEAASVGWAALARAAGRLPPRPAVPLYIDAPAAMAGPGQRPPPG
jgi:tRNA threonylcarbamoyl adenosine modification protein YeaZ